MLGNRLLSQQDCEHLAEILRQQGYIVLEENPRRTGMMYNIDYEELTGSLYLRGNQERRTEVWYLSPKVVAKHSGIKNLVPEFLLSDVLESGDGYKIMAHNAIIPAYFLNEVEKFIPLMKERMENDIENIHVPGFTLEKTSTEAL